MCTEAGYSYTATKGTCKALGCAVGITQGSVAGYKDVFASLLFGCHDAVCAHGADDEVCGESVLCCALLHILSSLSQY